jgi:hypothetical protein
MLGHLRRRLQSLPPRPLHSTADTSGSPDSGSGVREAPAAQWRWFSPSEEGVGMTAIAGQLFRLSDSERIGAARRANYQFLVDSCAKFGRAASLYPRLPAGVVPYAFPLVLRHPDNDFRKLKYLGIPIWRWDELAVSDCEVSRSHRTSLLQLPCHENLRQDDLNWITGVLGEVLA